MNRFTKMMRKVFTSRAGLLGAAVALSAAIVVGRAVAADDGGAVQYILLDDLANNTYPEPETGADEYADTLTPPPTESSSGDTGSSSDDSSSKCNQGVGNGGEGCNPGNSGTVVNNDEGPDVGPGNPGAKGGSDKAQVKRIGR